MIPGSKGLNPHELAHRWVKYLGTRPNIRISWDDNPTICEYWGWIVGVRSTEQSVGIKVGGF